MCLESVFVFFLFFLEKRDFLFFITGMGDFAESLKIINFVNLL